MPYEEILTGRKLAQRLFRTRTSLKNDSSSSPSSSSSLPSPSRLPTSPSAAADNVAPFQHDAVQSDGWEDWRVLDGSRHSCSSIHIYSLSLYVTLMLILLTILNKLLTILRDVCDLR